METKKHIRYSNGSTQALDSLLIIVCYLCSLFSVIFSYTYVELSSVLSYLKYLCVIFLYIKYAENSLSFFVPLLFFAFLGILSIISPYSYSFGRIVVIGMIPLWLYILKKVYLKEKFKIVVIAILLIYILYVMFVVNKSQINPNQLAFCYLLAFVSIYSLKTLRSISLLVFLILSMLCLLGIYLTGSRTSFLVFFVILFFSHFIQKRFHKAALFFFMICFMGVLIPYVYTELAEIYKGTNNDMLMNQELFSGRESVWNMIFNQFRDTNHFLYGGIELVYWDKSYHNSLFDIWVDMGFICLVAYVLIFTYYFWLYEMSISSKAFKVIYIICLSLTWGYFESGWFLGHAFSIMFPILLISKNNSKKANSLVLKNENRNNC